MTFLCARDAFGRDAHGHMGRAAWIETPTHWGALLANALAAGAKNNDCEHVKREERNHRLSESWDG
ncbi:MAG: hypothetical protein ABJ327_25750 [Litoreibacter sp.]